MNRFLGPANKDLDMAESDMRLEGFDFAELEARAKSQRERLERFRLRYAAEALRVHAA